MDNNQNSSPDVPEKNTTPENAEVVVQDIEKEKNNFSDKLFKNQKKLAVAFLFVCVATAGAVVALVIINNNREQETPQISYESPNAAQIEEKISTFNVKEADGNEGYDYLRNLLEGSFNHNMYLNAYDEEGYLKADVVISNIDEIVSKYNITDKDALLLVSLKKAEMYAAGLDTEHSWQILENIDKDNLLPSQTVPYYRALYQYYAANDNFEAANAAIERINAISEEQSE